MKQSKDDVGLESSFLAIVSIFWSYNNRFYIKENKGPNFKLSTYSNKKYFRMVGTITINRKCPLIISPLNRSSLNTKSPQMCLKCLKKLLFFDFWLCVWVYGKYNIFFWEFFIITNINLDNVKDTRQNSIISLQHQVCKLRWKYSPLL